MSFERRDARQTFARLSTWWRGLIDFVPPDLAACEYDCRRTTCDESMFEACDRRLQRREVMLAAEALSREATIAAAVPAAPAVERLRGTDEPPSPDEVGRAAEAPAARAASA